MNKTNDTCILIVDDDPWFRRFHQKLLRPLGRPFILAGNYQAFKEALKSEPALVVTDYNLGFGPNGDQIVRDCRAAGIPVVMVTGAPGSLPQDIRDAEIITKDIQKMLDRLPPTARRLIGGTE